MKIGTRIHVEFEGDLVSESATSITVEDEQGIRHRIVRGEDFGVANVYHSVLPKDWPPKPGDTWRHLDVTFLAEQGKDAIYFIASNDEGSIEVDEVLRMRPGIKLVYRPGEDVRAT